jgi:hypothetical protein
VEDGYLKYQPWLVFPADKPLSTMTDNSARLLYDRFKWNLFGPYSHHHILYTGIASIDHYAYTDLALGAQSLEEAGS